MLATEHQDFNVKVEIQKPKCVEAKICYKGIVNVFQSIRFNGHQAKCHCCRLESVQLCGVAAVCLMFCSASFVTLIIFKFFVVI